MKNIILAIGALAATGSACAQSSVQLFGTMDIAGRYVKADGQSRRLSESTDGLNSSQLVFMGTEDLGGGLKAGFTLNAGLNPDTGTTNSKFFSRQSTVSLFTPYGEIRLGRDYMPTFWNQAGFDPFGFVGIGATVNARQLFGGARQDNSVGYILPPNLGGFYGQAMASASEGGGALDLPGRYLGGRVGYAAGPLNVAVAYDAQRLVIPFKGAPAGDSQDTFNAGASWTFPFMKLMGYVDRDTLNGSREDVYSLGAVVPLGASEIHVGVDHSKLKNPAGVSSTVEQYKAGYVYNLSKRTAVYTNASLLTNKGKSVVTLSGANGPTQPGGDSKGIEFGLRHFF